MKFRDVVCAALAARGWRRSHLAWTTGITPPDLSKLLREDLSQAKKPTEAHALLIAAGLTFTVGQLQLANELYWPRGRRFRYGGDPVFLQSSSETFHQALVRVIERDAVSIERLAEMTNLGERLAWVIAGDPVSSADVLRITVGLCMERHQLRLINMVLASAQYTVFTGPSDWIRPNSPEARGGPEFPSGAETGSDRSTAVA